MTHDRGEHSRQTDTMPRVMGTCSGSSIQIRLINHSDLRVIEN